MTSVNTNAAAITALRTLQQTNNQLDTTQGRISTGLRIGEAKDNAAYWAISTTLKSDNKSLGTVKDALGLGSATVDVAYQGLNKAKDVLDEIKAKLTAATQPGVDRDVIQSEIGELQKQLASIASSSVFSGENWLSVDSSAVNYDSTKKIVSSFARDANNSVAIGTVDVAIGGVALFDSSTAADAGGIVDGAVNLKGKDGRALNIGGTAVTTGNIAKGGLADATSSGAPAAAVGTSGTAITTASFTAGTFAAADLHTSANTINFDLTVDGGTLANVSVSTTGTSMTNSQFELALQTGINNAVGSNKVLAKVDATTGVVTLTTTSINGTSSSLLIGSVTSTGTANKVGGLTVAGSVSTRSGTNPTFASLTIGGTTDLTGLAAGDKMEFTVNVNGSAITKSVTLNTLDVTDLAALLDTAFSGSLDVAETAANSNILKFTSTTGTAGLGSSISLTAVKITNASGVQKIPTANTNLPLVGTASTMTSSWGTAVTLDKDDSLNFDITVDSATASKLVTITKDLVDKALSTPSVPHTSGTISSITDFQKVMAAALTAANVNVQVTVGSGGNNDKLVFTSKTYGTDSKVAIANVDASQGGNKISVQDMNISAAALTKVGATTSDQINQVLSAYISAVNTAINKVTTAASNLGAVASRIDMQKSFVNTLMDTIDKGVGNLIDADMSEESTRLQALQTKQQLGVQALSIANQSSQNILSLFR